MADRNEASLAEEQANLVAEFLALRKESTEDPKQARKLSRLEGKLDALYWRRVEAILAARVDPEKEMLDFSDEDRLLMDMGLLDPALVEGASPDLSERLLAELHLSGLPNHFYLSEWLEERYRRYVLTLDVSRGTEGEAEESARGAMEARKKLLSRIAPLFQGLPGVPQEIANAMVQGQLDEQILRLNITLLRQPLRRLFLHRRRLLDLRTQVLSKARARAAGQETWLKMMDAVDVIYGRDWRERYAAYEKEEKTPTSWGKGEKRQTAHEARREAILNYLLGELRFVKTLLPLGALAGGVARSCTVLLQDGPRVTKRDTAACFALAQACDRGVGESPLLLIAPFRGRGIFEWDRDSLVVSLVPVAGAEDSVANAIGNFRMLVDSLQRDGELRKAYEARFPGTNFQQSFQADYRAWITQVGHGDDSKIDPERFAFFREKIGPDPNEPPLPPNLRHLGPQAQKAIRRRLEKQVATDPGDANLHRRLAVLCWGEKDVDAAIRHMAIALRLAPNEGEILWSLGLLLRAQGKTEQAQALFRSCAERAPGTIWGVYARHAMQTSTPSPSGESKW